MRRRKEKAAATKPSKQTSFSFAAQVTAADTPLTPPAASTPTPASAPEAPFAGPRVYYEIPGYWALGDDDKAKIDELMVRRAAERDAKEKAKK